MAMKKLVPDSEINYKRLKEKPKRCEEKYVSLIKILLDCILKSIYVKNVLTLHTDFKIFAYTCRIINVAYAVE